MQNHKERIANWSTAFHSCLFYLENHQYQTLYPMEH